MSTGYEPGTSTARLNLPLFGYNYLIPYSSGYTPVTVTPVAPVRGVDIDQLQLLWLHSRHCCSRCSRYCRSRYPCCRRSRRPCCRREYRNQGLLPCLYYSSNADGLHENLSFLLLPSLPLLSGMSESRLTPVPLLLFKRRWSL
jgi:hypothetical protein